MAIREWCRLPSAWIMERGLENMKWKSGGEGSDNTAALMALTVMAHTADEETGIAHATYDQLCMATGLSRAKLSKGLVILNSHNILTPEHLRSTYQLVGYDKTRGWAKFPVKGMYSGATIAAFTDFHLRHMTELDALKLFFLFVAHRDRESNFANIGYDKIEEYSGINRRRIKSGLSLLAALSLVYVEHVPSTTNPQGIANAYRIAGVEPYRHMGTGGRQVNAQATSVPA